MRDDAADVVWPTGGVGERDEPVDRLLGLLGFEDLLDGGDVDHGVQPVGGEQVPVADVETLTVVYKRLIERYFERFGRN